MLVRYMLKTLLCSCLMSLMQLVHFLQDSCRSPIPITGLYPITQMTMPAIEGSLVLRPFLPYRYPSQGGAYNSTADVRGSTGYCAAT